MTTEIQNIKMIPQHQLLTNRYLLTLLMEIIGINIDAEKM